MIPFVTIELDKPRRLRFGMGATVEFEQITKIKVMDLNVSDISGELCSTLVWVMLKQDDPALTIADSNKLIDDYASDMQDVISKVAQAITIAYKIPGEEKNG